MSGNSNWGFSIAKINTGGISFSFIFNIKSHYKSMLNKYLVKQQITCLCL